ncbi:A-kinase anchor protein 12 isoform X9 [Hippoglossus hippoglossus]|uniref:A-kinase anchor protein 12 isoform X9 n=1 Tax=Hippoglossus hippoglossus TaxID=8267 RepID=UPI00148B78C2|nr:A-kinase anchor protein 12 isoform X9 [Hippoglossus hippoglossus]
MGDAQSAQRDIRREAAEEEEEERGAPEDARVDHSTEEKPLRNNGQISEINGKADSTLAEVDDHCGDAVAADASLSPEKDVLQTARPLNEEGTPSENVEMNQKESPDETDAVEELPLEMTEMDAKQNDINESFKRFFSNIGLKLTVKRGSVENDEIRTDGPDETNKNKSDRPENTEDTADEPKSVNAEPDIDQKTQGTNDNDSTTCPTLTSEDAQENAEEKTTGAKDESDTETPSPVVEDLKEQQEAALEDEHLHTPSTTIPEAEEVVSPVKKFFTTGIFSGLRKKKKSTGDETTEKELVDMGRKETVQTTEKTVEVQQDKGEIGQDVEATTVEREHIENEPKERIISTASAQPMNDGESPPTVPATISVNEPEMSSQDRVQDSPMKWLLSGSSFRKLSKKQRGRKSSNTMLSDSEEHSDQLMSPTKSAETQKEESPAQHSAEAAGEDDGAWASFKKLVTPKKHMKKSSLTSEEIQISGSTEETKPSEKGQISDHSIEEGKKRKDSSVSWEAVLCRSGRRRSRSRKTSDSEDESPQVENDNKKRETPIESSNEVDGTSPASPNVGSPSEGDGGSTWKSFKKLVTPKRKAKDEEESKDNAMSDSEITQDDSSFSIKKFLPRKKKKSSENHDQVSSDEAEKEVVSGDEDSDTPAVVPLSEFDTIETEVHIETTADVESHVAKEADYQVQQDLLDQTSQPVLPCARPEPEVKKVQDDKDTLKNETSTALASNEEPEDLTELISKHEQLSDIPEEGLITETNATPASVPEEAAPDDTIAEDLIEITSEAITALEPVDITTEDETEMISAVSQLSDSSNTSGNTTPVPVEYEVKPTEVLLHQVVGAISISPNAVPVCSEEVSSERIVGSVLHEILETFVKEEPAVLKIHSKSDAASINIGLNVEELDKIDKLTTTAQIEGLSEVNKSVSTQIVSNVPTKEVATAEMAVYEVHEVNVLYPVERLNELESNNVSQNLVKTQSEANEAGSLEILPEGGAAVEDEGSLLGAHQDEKEPQEMNSQEVESTATVSEECTDGGVEEEVQTQIKEQIIDQVQVESQDQPVESDLQELPALNDAMLDSEEGSGQFPEKEVIKEDITAEVTDKPREDTEPDAEYNVEAEKENQLQADAPQTEHAEDPDVLETVQTASLDIQEGCGQLIENEEVKIKDIPADEMVTDKPQEETEPAPEYDVGAETETKLQAGSVKSEDGKEPKVLEAEQTLDSEDGIAHLLENVVISEDIPAEETATHIRQEEKEPLTENYVETETESKLQEDSLKTEHAEEPEALEPEPTAMLDPEEGSAQLHEKQIISEVTPAEEIVTDTPQEKTDPAEAHVETENETENEKKLQADSGKTEQAEEPKESVTLDLEEGSIQLLEKEVTSDDVPAEETDTDKPQEDIKSLTECNIEEETENKIQADAAETEHAEEPEVLEAEQTASLDSEEGSAQSLEEEVISESIPPEETVAHEVARAAEGSAQSELSAGDVHVEEPDVLSADVNDTATEKEPEVEASMPDHVVKPGAEESSAPNPEPTDSVTVESETQVVAALNHQALNGNEDQETEGAPQDVHVGQEDHIPEAVDEIQTLTAVHVPSVNDEACSAQVTEINVFSEVTPTPCVENVTVSHEPIHELHLSSVQSSVEEERGQIRGFEVKSAPVEHAVVAEVITCYLKDIAASIPDTLIETTSDSHEPLIDSVASELGFNETNETATPLVQNYVTKTGEEGSVVRMMNVPSVQFEDNHRIQVQVVDVDVKSANMKVDTVLEVVVTETRKVMDMCHATVQEVDKLSATSETEEKIRCEENKVTIQEVIQHVRESSPETVPESELVNTEQEVIKETDVVTETTEIPGSESSEVEGQKVVEDKERQDEGYDVISDDSATGHVLEDLMQTPDIPGGLDVLIHDPKEELEEPKAEVKKSEADVSTTELSSDVTKIKEEAQTPQIEIVTANTGLVVPQSTGVISSVGNVESPSSLSIELKFNIQFGHAKEPASPPPSTERTEPMKLTDVAEVGVQVEEPSEEINPAQSEERQKQTEGTEVTHAADLDSTERPVIINQPVLLDVGMQTVEIVEPVEQIKSTERGTPNVQAKETIQTVRQQEKRGVFLSQPLLSEVCDQETKAEEPVKHKEEENDQDVWMDAEEDINNQQETGMSLHEVQEPPQHQAISDQEEKVVLEAVEEFELVNSRIEGEESQEETLEKGETCETESEGEDFAVALEDPETATARITTME